MYADCCLKFCCLIKAYIYIMYYFLDNNECLTGKHKCNSNADCNNTKGSYTCTCKPGYAGDGIICRGMTDFIINSCLVNVSSVCVFHGR